MPLGPWCESTPDDAILQVTPLLTVQIWFASIAVMGFVLRWTEGNMKFNLGYVGHDQLFEKFAD